MTKKKPLISGIVGPLLIAMILLLVSYRVAANAQPSAAAAAVNIDKFVFRPQTLTVSIGTMVSWTNSANIPDTSVSTDGLFKSKVMDTGEKFSYTLSKAGTDPYHCTIHPKMTGKIIVL